MVFTPTAKQNFPDYTSMGHQCMVARYLTPEMYEELYDKKTVHGVTLDQCIQPSVDNTMRMLGMVAGDPECYEVFKPLFDACINEEHLGFGVDDQHPHRDFDADKLIGGDFDPKYVKSCRVRTARSIKGFCFSPAISRAERREVERILVETLSGMSGDLAGEYHPLNKMSPEVENRLIADHFLFQKPTGHLLVNSRATRDWPDARGIWHNSEKTFLVWVNEEDHCRVISMESGGNLRSVFQRLSRGLAQFEDLLSKTSHEFASNERLGYICTCPSNIGTGLRCSVHVQLHLLSKHEKFEDILKALQVQKRGTSGEHTEVDDDVFDISNMARLKKTEREFVQLVINAVNRLIEMEKRLELGESIDDLIPLIGGDFDPKYVKSCRVRTARSIKGFCFSPAISRAERREVEKILVETLTGMSGDLAGEYHPLNKMTQEVENRLIADHFLFQKPTGHLLVNSRATRDWPDARGIWHNSEKTFLVWVNEEDHCRVISMESGGNLRSVFQRLSRGLAQFENLLSKTGHEFASNERLGYICTCPSNIGTGLRCSVHVQLHLLSKHEKFEEILKALQVQKRGTSGEHTEVDDDVFDISNMARLKKTEREFVQLVINAVNRLIEMEKRLEVGESIDDLIPVINNDIR